MQRILTLMIGLLVALPVNSQGLREALDQAWECHPVASASAALEAEAQARVDLATGLTPAPAAFSISSVDDRLSQNRGKQSVELEFAVPLWLPGQKSAREAEARNSAQEVSARRDALRLQVAGELREAWWAVADARNAHRQAERRLALLLQIEQEMLRRLQAGDISRLEANLAQSERLAVEAELGELGATLRLAEQNYRDLTGQAAPALLGEERAVTGLAPADDHPLLRSVAASAALAHSKLRLADETRREAPTLAVRAFRDRADHVEPAANTLGLKLTIPFSSAPRVQQDHAAALAEVTQADGEVARARLKLQRGAERARLDLGAAQRQLALTRQRRELIADNLKLTEKAHALGESDLPALLRVRLTMVETEAALGRQQVAVAASQSKLNQVLGVLP